MSVLSVRHPITGAWVDIGTPMGSGINGPISRALDGVWNGPQLRRDVVALAGGDGVIATSNVVGEAGSWVPEFLVTASTPAAAAAKRDALKRLLPIGREAELQLGDAERVFFATPDRRWEWRVFEQERANNWNHGDRIVRIPFTIHDSAFYDDEDTVIALPADTDTAIALGTLPVPRVAVGGAQSSRAVITVTNPGSSYTLIAKGPDNTGLAVGAEYDRITFTGLGTGTLTIDLENQTAVFGVTNAWDAISAGWFFRLGEGLGETQVWLRPDVTSSLTYRRRW